MPNILYYFFRGKSLIFLLVIILISTTFSNIPGKIHTTNDQSDMNLIATEKTSVYSTINTIQNVGNVDELHVDGNMYTFSCNTTKVRVIFYKDDLVRIWMATNGTFTDPATDDIIVSLNFTPIITSWSDQGNYYLLESSKIIIKANKNPLTFSMIDKDTDAILWEETEPLSWDTYYTYQKLKRGSDEYFYGCGMQNGRFSHRDQSVKIEKDYNWNDGGHPNPAPFYMSTAGYGVYRNTWDMGVYDFFETVTTKHRENRFDAFFFYGPSLKEILDGYTELTGRPFMPPIYALELGDADCYNKDGGTTADVIKIADRYRQRDLPGGWFLPNDGYGCGYRDLEYVVEELHKRGFFTGLWTENGLPNSDWEVETAGVRVYKLDIVWVFPGYKFAFDAVKQAAAAIENNSDARRFVWTTMGWSGTQRYAVMWTGDQIGDWENIRFHIPTLIGSGLSGQAHVTGDIDGISGGGFWTYTRDLQWKAFGSVWMTMSGWARFDKQPWCRGWPYTEINKIYLNLKMRLMPYIYSYCHEAYETGVPIIRAMVLEFPDDPVTWDSTTQYQYMCGEWLLVAPVFDIMPFRKDIYLPEGKWIDYWDGNVYDGPQTIGTYFAPLNKLPLFVRAGAIIPMWPQMLHHREKQKDPLTFDIYPYNYTNFTLYEDDGVTREFQQGHFAEQLIEVDASYEKVVVITIGSSIGNFTGKLLTRTYHLQVHTIMEPDNVLLDSDALKKYDSESAFNDATEGWFFDTYEKGGILYVKTGIRSTSKSFQIMID